MSLPVDKLGRAYRIGQLLCYAVRRASNHKLCFGELKEIHESHLVLKNENGRRVHLKKLGEVVIVAEPPDARDNPGLAARVADMLASASR